MRCSHVNVQCPFEFAGFIGSISAKPRPDFGFIKMFIAALFRNVFWEIAESLKIDMSKTRPLQPAVSLPLPVLHEGWAAEKDFKAIDTLSPATQRNIEPVGPHFLAHARRVSRLSTSHSTMCCLKAGANVHHRSAIAAHSQKMSAYKLRKM